LPIKLFRNSFFKSHSYLLLVALLLLLASIVLQNRDTAAKSLQRFAQKQQAFITKSEQAFEQTINQLKANSGFDYESFKKQIIKDDINSCLHYVYAGDSLLFWDNNSYLPSQEVVESNKSSFIVKAGNGFYFIQKAEVSGYNYLWAQPIKWEYVVTNNYLKNNFVVDETAGNNFELSLLPAAHNVRSKSSEFLFSIKSKTNLLFFSDNRLAVLLRILSFLPLLFFLQRFTKHQQGQQKAARVFFVLFVSLLAIRLFCYLFYNLIGFSQFEIFKPSVYAAGNVLRSLADLLINILFCLWLAVYVKLNFAELFNRREVKSSFLKYTIAVATAVVLLATSLIASYIVQSLFVDSQISFDVLNFFSLNYLTIIGFVTLCLLATLVYVIYEVVTIYVIKHLKLPVGLYLGIVTSVGLLLLSVKTVFNNSSFQLYVLAWLLLFLVLIIIQVKEYGCRFAQVTKLLLWLCFFCISIAWILVKESKERELGNRKNYAEVIAEKANTLNPLLLNTILTSFRKDVVSSNFYKFYNSNSSIAYRDSLVNDNVSAYKDTYDTEVLVFDAEQNPLHNISSKRYAEINGIYTTQAKPTALPNMAYYDIGYDRYNYVSKIIATDKEGELLGYVFLLVQPKKFAADKLYPELFGRGKVNSIENSPNYAYALYQNDALKLSKNSYGFVNAVPTTVKNGNLYNTIVKSGVSELWYNAGNNVYVVIVKESKDLLAFVTLFSYLFFSFIVIAAIIALVYFISTARAKRQQLKNIFQLTIRQQVHSTIVVFSIVSFIVIAIATIIFFNNKFVDNSKQLLSKVSENMALDFANNLSVKQTDTAGNGADYTTLVNRLSTTYMQDVALFSTKGDLLASSLQTPFDEELLSTKMNATAFEHMALQGENQFFQEENIGTLQFASQYRPVRNKNGKVEAFLNIPYFTSSSKLQEEISSFLVTVINLNAFIFLVAGIVALFITNRITNSFAVISNKMKMLSLETKNEPIVWNRNDEIGELVNEYNKMATKLSESAAALAKSEREFAWQEMAKQVAHEIKNPLTPMKLSMQYLQKAIEENRTDIKELTKNVAETLVEQINHLSNIASDFSRFADIENVNPVALYLHEVVVPIQQLYVANSNVEVLYTKPVNSRALFADKTHINRIITNLVLNGIQAAKPNQKAVIEITERYADNYLELSITDNGSGISEESQAKIFMPSFTTKSSGTGLGLSMCKRMVEQAGGTINFVTSQDGTTFIVNFPYAN
jgi:two-component system, NtrC family, nitrogen regulation sensor histidine kinase NtrY